MRRAHNNRAWPRNNLDHRNRSTFNGLWWDNRSWDHSGQSIPTRWLLLDALRPGQNRRVWLHRLYNVNLSLRRRARVIWASRIRAARHL